MTAPTPLAARLASLPLSGAESPQALGCARFDKQNPGRNHIGLRSQFRLRSLLRGCIDKAFEQVDGDDPVIRVVSI